jgi:hypothetical protein
MEPIEIKTLQEAKKRFPPLSLLWIMLALNRGHDIAVEDERTGQEYVFAPSVRKGVTGNGFSKTS